MARQVTATKGPAKGKVPPAVQTAPKAPPNTPSRTAAKPAAAKATKKVPVKATTALPIKAPVKAAAPTTVTLKHIAAGLAERHDMQKREADTIVTEVFARLVDHLKAGERLRISGLGILEVKDRPARMGRNPATGEAVQIKASRKVAFRAAKELKDAI